MTTRLKVARTILTVFRIIFGLGLLVMFVWGLFVRPGATLLLTLFFTSVIAFFWAILVEAQEG